MKKKIMDIQLPIYSMTSLSKVLGISFQRVFQLVRSGRVKADYKDPITGVQYFSSKALNQLIKDRQCPSSGGRKILYSSERSSNTKKKARPSPSLSKIRESGVICSNTMENKDNLA